MVNGKSDGIKIDGHVGKWYIIDSTSRNGKLIHLLEHETYGDEAACIIVDEDGNVILNNVWNGFDDLDDIEPDDE